MTAQAMDGVKFQGRQFLHCGFNGPDPFDPESYGLKPEMPSTACYRGWMAEYTVTDRLILADLSVFHDAGLPVRNRKPNWPAIHGVIPKDPQSPIGFNCLYQGLNIPIAFSGGFLIARNPIRGFVVNMGFHPFWKFEEVHELILEEGMLVGASDKSSVAATVRENHLVKGILGHPKIDDDEGVKARIENAFSLRYSI